MNIWIFSSGSGRDNICADSDMLRSVGKKRIKLAFLPTGAEDGDLYFRQLKRRLNRHNKKEIDFKLYKIYEILGEQAKSEIEGADIVYLSGGNTFNLLSGLHKNSLLPVLFKRGLRGGLTAGHSAGAIVLSHDIRTAAYPSYDRDKNTALIKDLRGIRLLPFEVFPHYEENNSRNGWYDHTKCLKKYTKDKGGILYAIKDGQAIHVNATGTMTVYGGATAFCGGDKEKILPTSDLY